MNKKKNSRDYIDEEIGMVSSDSLRRALYGGLQLTILLGAVSIVTSWLGWLFFGGFFMVLTIANFVFMLKMFSRYKRTKQVEDKVKSMLTDSIDFELGEAKINEEMLKKMCGEFNAGEGVLYDENGKPITSCLIKEIRIVDKDNGTVTDIEVGEREEE